MRVHLSCSLVLISLFGWAQENQESMDVELLFQINSSKPGKDRAAKTDPAIMTSLLFRFSETFQAGLGTGLQSPHYNTVLMPVYAQLNVAPFRTSPIFLKTKLGNFIPINPREFEGGLFTEVALARSWNFRGNNSCQLSMGYAHQRMTFTNENWWWGSDRETTFRFNRLMFSAGFVF